MKRASTRSGIAAVVAAALLTGCSKDSTGPGKDDGSIGTIITAVTTSTGTAAVRKTGSRPAAGAGPTATLPTSLSVVNGGTSSLTVSGSAQLSAIILAMNGVDGYYQLTPPSAASEIQILVTLAQGLERSSIPIVVMGSGSDGAWGAASTVNATVTRVGTGSVQVSLSWDKPADLDLHVIDPNNDEVYYGHRTVSSGGKLDLDSNAACSIDNVNNENVTWPSGQAPSGTYKVFVDNWSSCGQSPINYVVTITVQGQNPKVFTGQFTDAGDNGSSGSGRLITTFTK